jgi:hypothetical protein
MATWERRSTNGFGYNLGYTQSGIHFNPGIGFEMMHDYAVIREASAMDGSLRRVQDCTHGPEILIMYRTYIARRSFMSLLIIRIEFQTKNQWQGAILLTMKD